MDTKLMTQQRAWLVEARAEISHWTGASAFALASQAINIAEGALESLEAARATWRCFNCSFETADRAEATAHFGDGGDSQPLCVIWSEIDDSERAQEYQSITQELNAERDENDALRKRVERLEYQVEGQKAEIHSFAPFRKCDTIHQVFHVYDSMEGRALLAEEQNAALRREGEGLRDGCGQANQRAEQWRQDSHKWYAKYRDSEMEHAALQRERDAIQSDRDNLLNRLEQIKDVALSGLSNSPAEPKFCPECSGASLTEGEWHFLTCSRRKPIAGESDSQKLADPVAPVEVADSAEISDAK